MSKLSNETIIFFEDCTRGIQKLKKFTFLYLAARQNANVFMNGKGITTKLAHFFHLSKRDDTLKDLVQSFVEEREETKKLCNHYRTKLACEIAWELQSEKAPEKLLTTMLAFVDAELKTLSHTDPHSFSPEPPPPAISDSLKASLKKLMTPLSVDTIVRLKAYL